MMRKRKKKKKSGDGDTEDESTAEATNVPAGREEKLKQQLHFINQKDFPRLGLLIWWEIY